MLKGLSEVLGSLNLVKFIEQLSPLERLIGFILPIVVILNYQIVRQILDERLKIFIHTLSMIIIISVILFVYFKSYKSQQIVKENEELISNEKDLNEKLKKLRERERELLRRESGSLMSIASRLEGIRDQIDTLLEKEEFGKQQALDVRNGVNPIIIEIHARVDHTDRRLRELSEVEALLNIDDEADNEMLAWVKQQNQTRKVK